MVKWLLNFATFYHHLGDLGTVIRAGRGWKNSGKYGVLLTSLTLNSLQFLRDAPGPQVEFIAHKKLIHSGSRLVEPGSSYQSSECYTPCGFISSRNIGKF
ncbi:hypothetical protein DPMN_038885 [Dreissena polymorpha]|uniref:Uncharacterized protein n=1 Tax=Dreissena polymorpha TaxID=45954 RepID=A0A9D4MDZ9_DREPO|nr:hypothetical protein DPMN_038885 [Dreissena polymorpha]